MDPDRDSGSDASGADGTGVVVWLEEADTAGEEEAENPCSADKLDAATILLSPMFLVQLDDNCKGTQVGGDAAPVKLRTTVTGEVDVSGRGLHTLRLLGATLLGFDMVFFFKVGNSTGFG
jgi:hypothetical protein